MRLATSDLSPSALTDVLGLRRPTAEQEAVIASALRPALVQAGAGSGKTETMASRVLWLVCTGRIDPSRVLGLTFTRKAATELSQRLRSRLAHARETLLRAGLIDHAMATRMSDGEPTVLTYHSYAAQLLSEQAARAGLEPTARLLGEAGCWQLAHALVLSWDGPLEDLDMSPAAVTDHVLRLSGELSEHLSSPRSVEETTAALLSRAEGLPRDSARSPAPGTPYAETAKVLSVQRRRMALLPLVLAYAEAKRRRMVLDYGDQICLAARLARTHPAVGESERARYGVVLLDEYQDTSQAQEELLVSLFGGGHPVTAVGDPRQAIYGWRGASAGSMERFTRRFVREHRETPTFTLSQSFRNGAAILDVANTVGHGLGGSERGLTSATGHAGTVRTALLETAPEEWDWIAERCRELIEEGTAPHEIAVLVRKRSLLADVHQALRSAGIPSRIAVLSGLLDVPEVADVVATLRVLLDPYANDAVVRLLSGSRWRFGPRDLQALAQRARALAATGPHGNGSPAAPASPRPGSAPAEDDLLAAARTATAGTTASLVSAMDDPQTPRHLSDEAGSRLRALARELDSLRRHATDPLPDLVERVVRTLLLDVEVSLRPEAWPENARADLARFVAVAADFERSAEQPTLGDFLAYLQVAADREGGLTPAATTTEASAVHLGTVHGAKGLEWDAVFVAGLTQGTFPDSHGSSTWLSDAGSLPVRERGDRADLPGWSLDGVADQRDLRDTIRTHREQWQDHDQKEEVRLAYVALTRARTWLGCSGSWWVEGARRRRGPSSVLTAIHERLTEPTARDPWVAAPEGDNPLVTSPRSAQWPIDPLGERREAIAAAAASVRDHMAAQPLSEGAAPSDDDPWREEVDRLLATRGLGADPSDPTAQRTPRHASVADIVLARQDPQAYARRLRRPMPTPPPSTATTLGTAFHAWLETRFNQAGPLDLEDPRAFVDGRQDELDGLPELREAFERSVWAQRTPVAVEAAFDTRLGDIPVRGRIDAVFSDPDGGFTVVDWKTGDLRRADQEAEALQLEIYRRAWAELAGTGPALVRAASHYVRENRTIWRKPAAQPTLTTILPRTSPEAR